MFVTIKKYIGLSNKLCFGFLYEQGRGGLGSVYVSTTGNSGGEETDVFRDSCSYDRLVANRYVISVAGIQLMISTRTVKPYINLLKHKKRVKEFRSKHKCVYRYRTL